ncbi:hypothetical protein [Halorarum salinum]|uniref:Uncharacterized protein n=1 Tax=Halorarum salinum TaxID=2743089 RepID=A0A7D5LBN7_9EURY|nr:hypothetical protein [Halobaculum salinum]QLG62933.1 hypothetical protein HUG12_14820 [Halobaculum salinum]
MATSRAIGRWTSGNVGYLGAALAFLVASIHLFHPQRGFLRLATFVTTGNASLLVSDPRPVAFVLSALAILLGINLVVANVARKRVYALGMALMVTYFVGYFAWHLSGHGGFLPGREPLYHGLHPVEAVISHLVNDPLAALAKSAEAALFVVLAVLYRTES